MLSTIGLWTMCVAHYWATENRAIEGRATDNGHSGRWRRELWAWPTVGPRIIGPRTMLVANNGVAGNGAMDNGVADNGISKNRATDNRSTDSRSTDDRVQDNGAWTMGVADNGVSDNGFAEDGDTDNIRCQRCGHQRWTLSTMEPRLIGPQKIGPRISWR